MGRRRRRRHDEELEQRAIAAPPEQASRLLSRPFDDTQTNGSGSNPKFGYNLQQIPVYAQAKGGVNQEAELVTAAATLAQDETAQTQLPDLEVPEIAKREEESTLNETLLASVNAYQKFLLHQGITRSSAPPIFGIRDPRIAHEQATRWMLSPNSGELAAFNQKQELAKQLVEIGGRDPSSGVEWATNQQVRRLKELLSQIQSGSQVSGKTADSDPKRELEQIIAEIMHRFGTQPTPAAEGYPKGDRRRQPNLRDTEMGMHVTGAAMDVFFDLTVNAGEPVLDAIAAQFGLQRPIAKIGEFSEPWHYELAETRLDNRIPGEEPHLQA